MAKNVLSKKKTFIEEVMQVVELDLDKIRTSPLMYISRVGSLGAIHLCKECINNNIDECVNINSPGDYIYICLDEDENKFISEDNGRGLPFDKMLDACTKMQSSTKFNRQDGQKSAGQNGCGMKATNALSKYFKLEVWKLGETATVEFVDGVEKQSGEVKKASKRDAEKHGTRVTFIPSEKYMGKCQMKSEDLMFWIKNISYFMDKSITLDIELIKKGKVKRIVLKRSKNGIADLVKEMSPLNHTPIASFSGTSHVKEDVKIVKSGGKVEDKVMERDIDVEFAFALNAERQEPMYRSFCNFVHTIDEGDHTAAIEYGLCQYLTKQVRDNLTDKEKEKYTIQFSDVRNSLILALSVNTSMDPGFTGQTKEKIENSRFTEPLRELAKNHLEKYAKDNPKEFKKFCDVVKANARARYESTKARNSVIKREVGAVAEHSIPNYFPANDKSKKGYRELFIFEGLSVKSNGTMARDPEYQAMFTMRGVPGEAYTISSAAVADNDTFKNLTQAINAGIGKSFDVTKSRFAKVIITSDGDIDGCFIFSLLGGFFLTHMRELIEDGRLYLALPPLYKIDDSKKPFVSDKVEYQEVFYRRVVDKFKLAIEGGKVLSKKEFLGFMSLNQYYMDELVRCANHYSANRYLLEFIIKYRDDKKFKTMFKKHFPEMNIEKDKDSSDIIFEGVCDGAYQIFTVDSVFDKKTEKLKKLMDENPTFYLEVTEKYSGKEEYKGTMSLGQFLELAQKLQPAIKLRYKGLGELHHDDLWDTTMNPETRTLVQLTVNDVEAAIKMYDTLHGKGKANLANRKEMTEAFEINLDMIDN